MTTEIEAQIVRNNMEDMQLGLIVGELCGQVKALTSTVNDLTNRVEKLNSKISDLEGVLNKARGGWLVIATGVAIIAQVSGAFDWIYAHVTRFGNH